MPYVRTYRGLGQSASQIAGTAGSIVSPVVSTVGGGALASAVGLSASLAIPIVGAAFAGVMIGIEAILNSGCGQTCVETSEWANQAASQLDHMIAAYFSIPAPRPQSLQQGCMNLFMQIWNTLVSQCSQPNLGSAGQNCISDRQDGACKWKALPPEYPGEPAAGACWNWWNAYYWPIANDANVVPDAQLSAGQVSTADNSTAGVQTAVASSTPAAPLSGVPWYVWAGLGLAAVWAVS